MKRNTFICPKCGTLGAGDVEKPLCHKSQCNYQTTMINTTNPTVWLHTKWDELFVYHYGHSFSSISDDCTTTFEPQHVRDWSVLEYMGEY